MATNTTNLNLIKPGGTDKIRIAQINQNMDILDEKIGPVGNTSLQAQMSTITGYTTMSNGTNLNALTNKANYLVGNISQMLNAPTGVGTSGFFYVEKNSSYILQRFWGDLDKAYRFSYNNGSTWTSWVVHKTQIDSLNSHIEYNNNTTITNLDSIPVNSQGRITLGGAVSPSGNEITVNFQCYGVSTRKTLEISSVNSGNSWTSVYDGTSWSSWVSIKDQLATSYYIIQNIGVIRFAGKIAILDFTNNSGQIPSTGLQLPYTFVDDIRAICQYYNGSANDIGELHINKNGSVYIRKSGVYVNATYVLGQAVAYLAT